MTSSRWPRTLGWIVALGAGCVASPPPGQVDANGDPCPLTDPRAEVTLTAYQGAAWVGMDVVGHFQRSTPAREAIACRHREVGACAIDTCENLGIDFVDGEPACGWTSAGAIVFTRGGDAPVRVESTARLTFTRDLSAGEALRVQTTGADVPPFAATVLLPQRTSVTGPDALVRGTPVRVAAGEGLTLTWAPTTSRVLVVVTEDGGSRFRAECSFDGAAGSGTLDPAALGAGTGRVEVSTEERVTQQAGVFPAVVRARWSLGVGAWLTRGE